MKALIIAANTFRELLRDRALLGLLVFAAAVIGLSEAFGMISGGEDFKFIIDISLAAMLLFSVLISVLGGTNLVCRETERKTIYMIVCRPVQRWQFVVGKYLGILMLLGVNVSAMSLMFASYLKLLGGSLSITLLQAIVMIFLEAAVVTSIALLLSTLTSPMLGAMVSFAVFLAGHGDVELKLLSGRAGSKFLTALANGAYYVVPNLENFNIRAQAAHYVAVEWSRVGVAGLWALAYSAIAVLLAVAVFGRKNF